MAVVMATAWDTVEDAKAFDAAMRTWIADGDAIASVQQTGRRVVVSFATNAPTLQRLEAGLTG